MDAQIRLRGSAIAIAAAAAALLCSLACSSSTKMTPLMEYAGVEDMTATELRIRVHEFALHYPLIIEEAAHKIETGTDDPEIWKRALLWKIYAIPAYHKAMFRVDPYAALIDTWVLTVQMRNYFDSGPGAGTFGDLQHIALEAAEGLESGLVSIALLAMGEDGVAEARSEVNEWAGNHPIQSHFFIRDSIIPLVADVMGGGDKGWIRGFESLEESVQELRMRLTIYTDIIPRQVQWQLELTSLAFMEDSDIQTAFKDISKLGAGLDRMETSLAGGFDRTAASVDGVNYAISGGFDGLGGTLLEGIRKERLEALAGLSSDMEPVLGDLKKILEEGAATYEARTRSVVDYIFWRSLVLVAALIAGLVIYRITPPSRRK